MDTVVRLARAPLERRIAELERELRLAVNAWKQAMNTQSARKNENGKH